MYTLSYLTAFILVICANQLDGYFTLGKCIASPAIKDFQIQKVIFDDSNSSWEIFITKKFQSVSMPANGTILKGLAFYMSTRYNAQRQHTNVLMVVKNCEY